MTMGLVNSNSCMEVFDLIYLKEKMNPCPNRDVN